MAGGNGLPPPSPVIRPSAELATPSGGGDDAEEFHVMSEVHLGCPPNFSGPFISNFTFSLPTEIELMGSKDDAATRRERGSAHHKVVLDNDGDLVLARRSKHSKNNFVMTIQHSITSSIPTVGLQVWRAELVLSDFVLHKMLTSSDFDGIVAVELGAGAGLVGILLARVAKTVFITDHGDEVLKNCAKNVHLNFGILPHKASVYVRELDWRASWPPQVIDNRSSHERYAWILSDVEELHTASLLVAADVIYSDDLTDAFFDTLERLMCEGCEKVLYMALEKRYNFTLDDLSVVANGYSRFRSYVRNEEECHDLQNGPSPCFVGTLLDLSEIPQYVVEYDRGKDVEIWRIKYVRRKI